MSGLSPKSAAKRSVSHTRCESTRARVAGRVVSSLSRVRSDPRAPRGRRFYFSRWLVRSAGRGGGRRRSVWRRTLLRRLAAVDISLGADSGRRRRAQRAMGSRCATADAPPPTLALRFRNFLSLGAARRSCSPAAGADFFLVFHRALPDLQRMKTLPFCGRVVGIEVGIPLVRLSPFFSWTRGSWSTSDCRHGPSAAPEHAS